MKTNIGITGNNIEIIATLLNTLLADEITPVAIEYKDLGTADFLTGLMKQHEKMAWMLRSFLS